MNKNVQGHIFALTANILWGLMAPIGKSALMEFSALSVTTFRMVGAAACFWLLSAFCKYEHVLRSLHWYSIKGYIFSVFQ